MCHRFSRALTLIFLLHSGFLAPAQKKAWIYDKDTAELSSVSPGLSPRRCSEWLLACSYQVDRLQEKLLDSLAIDHLPVRSFGLAATESDSLQYGFALEQIEAHLLSERRLTGKGIKIGVIDGGFLLADKSPSLSHLVGNIVAYRDYITPELEKYGGLSSLDDRHGTDVLQLIGGYHPGKQVIYGLATDAVYYLARTDHGGYEKRIEEDYLIQALEWMAGEGVKLVNISLGYNKGFNDPEENYLPAQMNGKTTMVARAVEVAATEKGMLIVVAAGNEAVDPDWKIISSPADARHALTVGASKFDLWDKTSYSSIGPEFIPYVKPDLVVYSTSGTSFAAPVITGLAACLMQYDSSLTNLEIIDLLKKSANFYPYPNNYVGYGVPTCSRILHLLNHEEDRIDRPKEVKANKGSYLLKGDFSGKYLVLFHKADAKSVKMRMVLRPKRKQVKIRRPEAVSRTSVLIEKEVVEIFWE